MNKPETHQSTNLPAIVVTHVDRDRLRIAVRGHLLSADQPVADGGDDTAPTPTEMFLSSLAACVTFNAERFLRRNQRPPRASLFRAITHGPSIRTGSGRSS